VTAIIASSSKATPSTTFSRRDLVYLSGGLALILAFIGVKLILHWGHGLEPRVPEITTAVSLVVIGVVLAVTTVASLIKSRRDPTARAHAGAVVGTLPRHVPDQHRPSGR
jgi:predicted tellurium resistance membrane protein TerC